jgi:hypothetical protein
MDDSMIVSRMIFGAECDPKLLAVLRNLNGFPDDTEINLCLMQTTVSRGERTGRVLCCWAGGKLDKNDEIDMSLVGRAAVDALMRLPACMDDRLADKGRLVIRELRLGRTPLREKVINAVLEAEPGDRICFIGDLAGELDGQMAPAFNIMDGEPILLKDME